MNALTKILFAVVIVGAIAAIWLGIDWGLWRIYVGVVVKHFHAPYIGYWPFFFLLLLISAVAGFFRSSVEVKGK